MASGLRAAGHPVTVICARSAGTGRRIECGVEVIPTAWLDVEAHARRVGLELRDMPRPRGRRSTPRNTVLREMAARLTVPDRYVIWVPGAVATALRHGRQHDMLVSTGPVSAHLAARTVLAGRPWLADINDLWALNPHRTNGRLRDVIDVFLERRVLGAATQLTTVNDAMRDELRRRTGKSVTTVFSGFDPDDFAAIERSGDRRGAVRLLYAGALYPSQNLEPLFRAVAALRRDRALSVSELEVSFIGRVTDRAALEAERFGVGDLVTASDPIERHELLARMCRASALILPLNDDDRSALPIKIFEYVGAARPIIAWGDRDSLAARVILENGFGVVAASDEQLGDYIGRVIAHDETLPSGDDEARARFTWRRSVDALTELVAA